MLKISLLFNKLTNFTRKKLENSKKIAKISGYFFIWTQTYRETLKSALVYL